MSNFSLDDKTRDLEERRVALEFQKTFRQRQQELRQQWGDGLGLSTEEIALLNDLQSGYLFSFTGMAAAVATVSILQGARGILGRRLLNGHHNNYNTKRTPVASPFRQKQTPPTDANGKNTKRTKSYYLFAALDAIVGAIVGVNVTVYMTRDDRQKAKKMFSNAPLVQGRSGIADQFCSVMVREFQTQEDLLKRRRKETIVKEPQLPDLAVFLQFIQHCRMRQALEEVIRDNEGIDRREPVELPVAIPSVPGSLSKEKNDYDWGSERGADDDEFSIDHAASFVSDQEEGHDSTAR